MFSNYYTNLYFRAAIVAYVILASLAFAFWYVDSAEFVSPTCWLVVYGSFLVTATFSLYPTRLIRLPDYVVPVIMIFTLWTVQLTLDALPHMMTIKTLMWPILMILLISVIMVLRKHPIAGWFTFVLSAFLVISWHSDFFVPYFTIILQFLVPLAIMLTTHALTHQVEQSHEKAIQSRNLLRNAEFGSVQEQGASNIAAQRVQEVRDLAEDMLHRIAFNPSPLGKDEIDDFRFAEAQLRDTIRGRHIVNQEILVATLAARKRGTKVDILDERGEQLPQVVVSALTPCAIDLLDDAKGGTITIRAFSSDDPIAVMLVHDGNAEDDESSAIEISQSGEVDRF